MPKFIIFVRSSEESESGYRASTERIAKMMVYNRELVDAGVMAGGDTLMESTRSTRIYFDQDSNTTTKNGPFDIESLVHGFWIFNCKDMDEAVAWARKAPYPNVTMEVRQVLDYSDYKGNVTEEMKSESLELRKDIAERTAASKLGKQVKV